MNAYVNAYAIDPQHPSVLARAAHGWFLCGSVGLILCVRVWSRWFFTVRRRPR